MANSWIRTFGATQHPKFRIFCFPYAGGGASTFRNWQKYLPDSIEICALQLPGREDRISEKPIDSIGELIKAFHHSVSLLCDGPFAFFGHSMGAIIAYEYSLYLSYEHGIEPNHLFVSGRRPPQLPMRRAPIHRQGRDEFIRSVRRLGGASAEVWDHEEIMALMIPVLRADFTLSETYQAFPGRTLSCPITVFGGEIDHDVPVDELEEWRDVTIGRFQKQIYPGGHFFLHSMYEKMISRMATDLAEGD